MVSDLEDQCGSVPSIPVAVLGLCYDWVCYNYKFESTEDRATAI